jgi:putative transposase
MVSRWQRLELDPTAKQKVLLRQAEGLSRYAWNWLMNIVLTRKPGDPKLDFKLLTRKGFHEHLKQEATWAFELPLRPAWEALTNCKMAWIRHWKSPQKQGRPRFKRRQLNGSCYLGTIPRLKMAHVAISTSILEPIKLKHTEWVPPANAQLQLAVLKLCAGRYFISILYRVPEIVKPSAPSISCGIDLGINEAVVVDDNGLVERRKMPRPLKRKQRRLRILQRRLARKKCGSRRRFKICQKINVLHWRISNVRRHFNHTLSLDLSRRYQTIVIEDLVVSALLPDNENAGGISDAGWSSFRRMLEYKVKERSGNLVVANRYFPSSQLCTVCGIRSGSLPLHIRNPVCGGCGHVEDRDTRAATNLLTLAGQAPVSRAWSETARYEAPTLEAAARLN